MPRPGLFRVGVMWLRLIVRQWLAACVFFAVLVAVFIVYAMLGSRV